MKQNIKKYSFWLLIFPLLQVVLFTNGAKPYDKPVSVFVQKNNITPDIEAFIDQKNLKESIIVATGSTYDIETNTIAEIIPNEDSSEGFDIIYRKDNMLSFLLFDDYSKKTIQNINIQYAKTAENWFQKYLVCGLLIIFMGTISKFLFMWVYHKTQKYTKSFLVAFGVAFLLFFCYTIVAQLLGDFYTAENFYTIFISIGLFIIVNLCITRLIYLGARRKEKRLQKIIILVLPDILLSNLILPLENMSVLAQYISKIVPSSYMTEIWMNSVVKSTSIGVTPLFHFTILVMIYTIILIVIRYLSELKETKKEITFSK